MKTLILSGIRCFLMFTAAGAFSVAHPAKANLITNGGFETGDFTGWTVSGDTFVHGTYAGISPHSGNFQALVGGNLITEGFLRRRSRRRPANPTLSAFGWPTFRLSHSPTPSPSRGEAYLFSGFSASRHSVTRNTRLT